MKANINDHKSKMSRFNAFCAQTYTAPTGISIKNREFLFFYSLRSSSRGSYGEINQTNLLSI